MNLPLPPPAGIGTLLRLCGVEHAYLKINGADYGFFCANGSRFPRSGIGVVRGPGYETVPANCVVIDCINENALTRNIQLDISNPPNYEPLGFNCQRWARDHLMRAFDPKLCQSCR